MPSLLTAPIPEIIRRLSVADDSVQVEAAPWRSIFRRAGQEKLWRTIFRSRRVIGISRGRLLTFAYREPQQKCAEILLWANPNPNRDRFHRLVSRLLPVIDELARHANSDALWREYWAAFRPIKGAGKATVTRLAYFHHQMPAHKDLRALMLDGKIAKNLAHWDETEHLAPMAPPMRQKTTCDTWTRWTGWLVEFDARRGRLNSFSQHPAAPLSGVSNCSLINRDARKHMSFIDPNNTALIGALNRGDFALPMISYPSATITPLLSDTPGRRRSILAMQTILNNQGFSAIAARINAGAPPTLPQQLRNLENKFLADMIAYQFTRSPTLLEDIFHMVQFWGGIAGRNIYVMHGGFATNFNLNIYSNIVAQISLAPGAGPNDARIPSIITAATIPNLGVAFVTKHIHFWSQALSGSFIQNLSPSSRVEPFCCPSKSSPQQASSPMPLPIYDRIMARGCLGLAADWCDYANFVRELNVHASFAGVSQDTMAYWAFEFFDTPLGRNWLRLR